MDRIRVALGDATMNYLGFSYGTELGAVYAHLFPKRIRVAALDGAVDPKLDDLVSQSSAQVAGFEQAFDQFAADCVTRDPCRELGDPRQAVYAIRDQAATSPIRSSDAQDPRRATASLVLLGVLQALYSRDLWPTLGTALLAARRGDAKGLLALADDYSDRDESGQYSNFLDVYFTVTCNDLAADPDDATIQAMGRAWATQYPMFGLWQAAALTQCSGWQKQRTPIPPETAASSAPILVVGNLHDPATPYAGAVNLTKELGRASLLTVERRRTHLVPGGIHLRRPCGQRLLDQQDASDSEHHLPRAVSQRFAFAAPGCRILWPKSACAGPSLIG